MGADDDKIDMSGATGQLAVNLNKKLVNSTTKDEKKKMQGARFQKALEKAANEIVTKEWREELKQEFHKHIKIRDADYNTLSEVLESTTRRQSEFKQIDEEMNPSSIEKTKVIGGVTVDKADNVVQLLSKIHKGRNRKMQIEQKLKKLITRIDLDRPILAQEKMKFIMQEKKDTDGDETSQTQSQLSQTMNSPIKAQTSMAMTTGFDSPNKLDHQASFTSRK